MKRLIASILTTISLIVPNVAYAAEHFGFTIPDGVPNDYFEEPNYDVLSTQDGLEIFTDGRVACSFNQKKGTVVKLTNFKMNPTKNPELIGAASTGYLWYDVSGDLDAVITLNATGAKLSTLSGKWKSIDVMRVKRMHWRFDVKTKLVAGEGCLKPGGLRELNKVLNGGYSEYYSF